MALHTNLEQKNDSTITEKDLKSHKNVTKDTLVATNNVNQKISHEKHENGVKKNSKFDERNAKSEKLKMEKDKEHRRKDNDGKCCDKWGNECFLG